MRAISLTAVAAALLVGGCGGGDAGGSDNAAADANRIAEDPYGATGAPGADLTDNGVTDGANGLADGDAALDTNLASPLRIIGNDAVAAPPTDHQ